MLYPIIPDSSIKALKMFNIKENDINFSSIAINDFLKPNDKIQSIDGRNQNSLNLHNLFYRVDSKNYRNTQPRKHTKHYYQSNLETKRGIKCLKISKSTLLGY